MGDIPFFLPLAAPHGSDPEPCGTATLSPIAPVRTAFERPLHEAVQQRPTPPQRVWPTRLHRAIRNPVLARSRRPTPDILDAAVVPIAGGRQNPGSARLRHRVHPDGAQVLLLAQFLQGRRKPALARMELVDHDTQYPQVFL